VSPAPAAFDLAALDAVLAREVGWTVAFSGGVDSSVLLAAAAELRGRDRVVAVLADSPSLARREKEQALATAAALEVELVVLATDEMTEPRYRANTGDRCFWCKEALFTAAAAVAAERGWAMAYGEQADDLDEDRPGARSAAGRGVQAPLAAAGWGKEAVRAYARARGLAVADKISSPCLASRVATGQAVDAGILARIEGLEAKLQDRGFHRLRARHLGRDHLRFEFADAELARARGMEAELRALAAAAGYARMELAAYRRGAVAAVTEVTEV
jgi:uncharacterized protein